VLCPECGALRNRKSFYGKGATRAKELRPNCIECRGRARREARSAAHLRWAQPCAFDGCRFGKVGRRGRDGLCAFHAYRKEKFGDPALGRDPRTSRESTYRNADGYVVVYDDEGRRRGQHQVVMERILGRRLTRKESVHHKNGDRADNRPENLELWSKAQPAGQRVVDKIAWAKELLELYEPEALAFARRQSA